MFIFISFIMSIHRIIERMLYYFKYFNHIKLFLAYLGILLCIITLCLIIFNKERYYIEINSSLEWIWSKLLLHYIDYENYKVCVFAFMVLFLSMFTLSKLKSKYLSFIAIWLSFRLSLSFIVHSFDGESIYILSLEFIEIKKILSYEECFEIYTSYMGSNDEIPDEFFFKYFIWPDLQPELKNISHKLQVLDISNAITQYERLHDIWHKSVIVGLWLELLCSGVFFIPENRNIIIACFMVFFSVATCAYSLLPDSRNIQDMIQNSPRFSPEINDNTGFYMDLECFFVIYAIYCFCTFLKNVLYQLWKRIKWLFGL